MARAGAGLINSYYPYSPTPGSRSRPGSGATEALTSIRLDHLTLRIDRLALMHRTWRGTRV
jgi:hypothetical protein